MAKQKADRSAKGHWMAITFATQLEGHYRREMANALVKEGFDLSVREWHALAYLASCSREDLSVLGRWPPTRAGVMRALGIDMPATSKLIGGLIRKDYLAELEANARDRRVKALVLAMRGRSRLRRLLAIEEKVTEEIFASAGLGASKELKKAAKSLSLAFSSVDLQRWSATKDGGGR